MNKRLSKVFNDFHNECKHFFLPNWCYFTCLGILLWVVFLWGLLFYSYTHYPSRLLEGVYDVTSVALLVIIKGSIWALIIGLLGPVLIATISAIVMNSPKTDVSQNSVETPAYALQASPDSEDLSIHIPSNFEDLFKTWFTTRQGDLVRITGNKTLISMMKAKMVQIKEWCPTDLQRLAYLLYGIGAVANDKEKGKKLSYKDWVELFFSELGRIPPKPDSKAKELYSSRAIDFKESFEFLFKAAQLLFPEINPDFEFDEKP